MNHIPTTKSRARLRTWLVVVYALLIIYASLSPFTGWREQGLSFADVLGAPLRLTYTPFDAVVNVLAYVPFGFLVCLVLRVRFGAAVSMVVALCIGALLSGSMEYLQMYLPTRSSSNMDLLSNSTGTLIGALLAVAVSAQTRLVVKLTDWRTGLFRQGAQMDFGLALLALWMFGQVNPSLPMLGNIFISEAAHEPFVKLAPAPFNWWAGGAVTLNLLMLGTLMATVLRIQRKAALASLAVLGAVAILKFFAAALLLKSWALLLWINGEAMLGILIGILLLLVVLRFPRSATIAFGAAIALVYFAIVNFVMDSSTPHAAASAYYWHYGHLLTYNGLALAITLAFPIVLLFHLWRVRKV